MSETEIEHTIAHLKTALSPSGFQVYCLKNPDLIMFVCGDVVSAYRLVEEVERLDSELLQGFSVQIWLSVPGSYFRYDQRSRAFQEHRTMLTVESSIQEAIAFAQSHSQAVEITCMATHNTLHRNGVDIRATEGVIWTPERFKSLNALFYWQSFPEDLHFLLQELRLYGKVENEFRNDRLDGNGYNTRTASYQLIQGARVSILHEWEHHPLEAPLPSE